MNGSVAMRAVACVVLALSGAALGQYQAFERIQVEQVVGGVGGDTSAQAIQLRLRFNDEKYVAQGRLIAYDANGANPILLADLGKNVANGLQGDRVLIATNAMKAVTTPAVVPDFIMANPIPPSYLSGGRITWECDCGIIYWSLTAGGYIGLNTGAALNDADGDFGAPFAGGFPSAGAQGLRFGGAPSDLSTTNTADYSLTQGPAVLTNNHRKSFTVALPPAAPSDLAGTELLKGVTELTWSDNSENETGFRIRRQQLVGGVWTNTGFVGMCPANSNLYFEVAGVGVWRYQVQALNGGVPSAFTPYVKVRPAPPSDLSGHPAGNSVVLGWTDGSSFESKYEVQRSKRAGKWGAPSIVATLAADSVGCVDSPGSGTYRYRVRSGNPGGVSAWTPWVEISLP